MAPLGNYSGLKPGFLKFKCHFFLPTESLSDKTNKSVNFPFSLMGLYFPRFCLFEIVYIRSIIGLINISL